MTDFFDVRNFSLRPVFVFAVILALFFVAVFADSIYYHERFSIAARDIVISAAFLAAGAVIMIACRDNMYAFLIGTFTAVSGNFGMLLWKYKKGD